MKFFKTLLNLFKFSPAATDNTYVAPETPTAPEVIKVTDVKPAVSPKPLGKRINFIDPAEATAKPKRKPRNRTKKTKASNEQ
jgi:hypothetical protein